MSAPRVLVTGATGFLGGHALASLCERGDVEPIAACRAPERLRPGVDVEVRAGDLRDPRYRRAVVADVDVVCHAGTWGALWGHRSEERTHFLEPGLGLVDCAIEAGVGRFVLASTVAIAEPSRDGSPVGDFAAPQPTGFWPHLDRLIELDGHMRGRSGDGTEMVVLRLGHFVGRGNRLGLVPILCSRLRTRLVPWLAGGRARLPLVADTDLGEGCALAATATGLAPYESFNICGPEHPPAREVIGFIAQETGLPEPWFSVPYAAGHAFGRLMEGAQRAGVGASPFLTRSIIHLARDRYAPSTYAAEKLGYVPRKGWRTATREVVAEIEADAQARPRLAQPR